MPNTYSLPREPNRIRMNSLCGDAADIKWTRLQKFAFEESLCCCWRFTSDSQQPFVVNNCLRCLVRLVRIQCSMYIPYIVRIEIVPMQSLLSDTYKY